MKKIKCGFNKAAGGKCGKVAKLELMVGGRTFFYCKDHGERIIKLDEEEITIVNVSTNGFSEE